MRQHRRYARLSLRYDPELFRRVVSADGLIAARLDPGFALRVDSEGLLDLVFGDGERFVVVPFVVVQAVMLLMRERSPYIWPAWLPPLRADVLREIEAQIDPWCSSLVLSRFANVETIRLFGNDKQAHALFGRAREAGFLGAAPTETVMRAIAPYVYAMRFSKGRSVGIDDRDGASGAALLSRDAASVHVNLGDPVRTADARRWFDLACFDEPASQERYDVSIGLRSNAPPGPVRIFLDGGVHAGERAVEIATAMPPAVTVSFDLGDSEAAGGFAVAASPVPVRPGGVVEPQVVGGSTGRIALVVRGDYLGNDDADVDWARGLEARLSEQGFAASVVPGNHLRPSEFDLLHVCGRRAIADAVAAMEKHRGPLPPVVATLYLDDPAGEAAWGATLHSQTITNALDDVLREAYFDAIERRSIDAPAAPKRGSAAPGDAEIAALLRRAGALITSSEEEERRFREAFGYSGFVRHAPAVPAADIEPAEVGAIAGLDDFIFVHAPLEPRCNQFAIVRAAGELGYPIVLCGTVQDVSYYGEVMGILPGLGMWLASDQIDAGQLAAMYRRARVYVDASWSGSGLSRLARAGAGGAALVAPTTGYARGVWPGLAQMVDPGSLGGIKAGIRTAWERAGDLSPMLVERTKEIADPFQSLVAVLAAYQYVAQAVSSQS